MNSTKERLRRKLYTSYLIKHKKDIEDGFGTMLRIMAPPFFLGNEFSFVEQFEHFKKKWIALYEFPFYSYLILAARKSAILCEQKKITKEQLDNECSSLLFYYLDLYQKYKLELQAEYTKFVDLQITDCSICFESISSDVDSEQFLQLFFPCKHAVCKKCSQTMEVCPFCRQSIHHRIGLSMKERSEDEFILENINFIPSIIKK